jgi:hypothetical protein
MNFGILSIRCQWYLGNFFNPLITLGIKTPVFALDLTKKRLLSIAWVPRLLFHCSWANLANGPKIPGHMVSLVNHASPPIMPRWQTSRTLGTFWYILQPYSGCFQPIQGVSSSYVIYIYLNNWMLNAVGSSRMTVSPWLGKFQSAPGRAGPMFARRSSIVFHQRPSAYPVDKPSTFIITWGEKKTMINKPRRKKHMKHDYHVLALTSD